MPTTDTILWDFDSMFTAGPRARRTDPDTSHLAADSNESHISHSQDYVSDTLWLTGPLADHELVARCEDEFDRFPQMPRYTPQRIRSARAELVRQGRVEFTGIFRLTPSGRRAQVWAVVS